MSTKKPLKRKISAYTNAYTLIVQYKNSIIFLIIFINFIVVVDKKNGKENKNSPTPKNKISL